MGIRGLGVAALAIVAAAIAYGIYAPDSAARWFPSVGPAAVDTHTALFGAKAGGPG